MSLETNLRNFATRVATANKALRTLINGNMADLSALTTTDKSNLVAAINEIKGSSGVAINDGLTSTTSTWSSTKTVAEIAARQAALIDAAPGALDTLNELAAAMNDDPNFATTVMGLLSQKAPISHSHTSGDLPAASATVSGISEHATLPEAVAGTDTARVITVAILRGITGNPETDLVAVFDAGLV